MSLSEKFGIPAGLLDAVQKSLNESNEYQKKVQAHMAKKGIKSLNDLTGDQKKKFFNELDAMHTAKNEEVDQIDELNKDTVYSYKKKSEKEEGEAHEKLEKQIKSGDASAANKTSKKIMNRLVGQERAEKRLNTEEVESVEEEMKGEMHPDAHKVLKHIKPEHQSKYKAHLKKGVYKGDYRDRAAVLSAAEKAGHIKEEVAETQEYFTSDEMIEIEQYMQTEEFAQLDELSKTTLGNYIKKRSHDVATQGALTRKHAMDSEAAKKDDNFTQQRRSNEKADKSFAKGWKHRQNIAKAVDKLTKEDQEFIDSLNAMQNVLDESTKVIAKHKDVEVHSMAGDSEGSSISVRKGGKEIASGDFDRGSDSFWVNHSSFKGSKSFDNATDIAKHFAGM